MNHELYMKRCFDLAALGIDGASPNPLVGCCIVHSGRIIGEGWHQKYGEAHAEVNAVASIAPKDLPLLSESTLYVTLEPCCYHGNTPPCTNLILKHKIPRVVFCNTDPNPRIDGGGAAQLRAQGVEVMTGILSETGAWLNRRFFTFIQKKRPHIILKYALSADGYMGKEGEQVWLTGAASARSVHKLRSEEDAILVGTNTAVVDRPRLTNRHYSGKSPLRIILDRQLRFTLTLAFDGKSPLLIFTDITAPDFQLDIPNLSIVKIDFKSNILEQVLDVLYERKVKSLIVEGGAKLLNSFIEAGLWDEARVYTADGVLLGDGIPAPQIHGRVLERASLGADSLVVYGA